MRSRRDRGLTGYVLRRLLQGVGVLWAAYTIAFVVLYLLPSDPVRIMLAGSGTEFANPDPAAVAALEAQYGFDKPVIVQYVTSLGRALTGDLGTSIQRSDEVTSMLAAALGHTAVLGGVAFGLALVGGLLLAIPAAFTRRPSVRQTLLGVPSVAVSVPTFWTGLLLTQVVSFQLGWVDVFDQHSVGALLLPAVTLAIPTSAYIAQVLSKSLLSTLREPYTEVIRSHGASEARIVLVSALRNASLPLLTMIGVIVGNLLAGSVVVEAVFARDGIGNMTFQAVAAQDIPVVMGVVLLAAAIFVVISIAVDLVYPLLDPRVMIREGDTPPAAAPIEVAADVTAAEPEVVRP
ncbi:ABC transporter permease [Pseudonocardia ailaonensis]|uniref:ABC transporter permease n=1 Tax=Pseudonocardia ailaonensis TaxID=367279 RepID=A0ABN2N8H9_9PSEU